MNDIVERLKSLVPHPLREGVQYQDGSESKAPLMVFADEDYEPCDGRCGLVEDGKYANEPAIVYVRADEFLRLSDEIERLREALQECADSLEAYVEHEYVSTKDHPAMKWRYERDMEDVYRARALLEVEDKDD